MRGAFPNATPQKIQKMRFKTAILAACALMTVAGSACSDDDDDDFSDTDPRIRYMAVEGLSTTFVVNDVEGIIYNYDSLTYGTDISALVPSFFGYDVSPTIEYWKDGAWVTYSNDDDTTHKLNMDQLKIRSSRGGQTKEYTIDLRVHKVDVNSFLWTNIGTLPVEGTVTGEKAVLYNSVYYLFYSNTAGNSYLLKSSDEGCSWTGTAIAMKGADWNTLSETLNGFVVLDTTGKAYVAGTDGAFTVAETGTCTLVKPLYVLSNKFWAIGQIDGVNYLCATAGNLSEMTKVAALPDGFTTENLSSTITHSGATTKIAYVYTTSNGEGKMWAVDNVGNFLSLSTGGVPYLEGTAVISADSEIGLLGGVTTAGKPSTSYYTSSDGGLTWTDNWHKTLPGNIGGMAYTSTFANTEGTQLLLIGGQTADGYSKYVWHGILKE